MYAAAASWPFAAVATRRWSPWKRIGNSANSCSTMARPWNHSAAGGIAHRTSSRSIARERARIIALPRRHVAREHGALRLGGRRERRPAVAAARHQRSHRRVRALQRAGHRRDRQLEQLGHLLRRPAEHVAQDQDRALARRQVLQRREERELDRLARRRDRLGIEQPIRERLQPGQLGCERRRRARLVVGRDRAHDVLRQHARPPVLERVEARRSSRCGAARSTAARGPRTARAPATRAEASPAPDPRRRRPSRSSGSSARGACGGAPRTARRTPPVRDRSRTAGIARGGRGRRTAHARGGTPTPPRGPIARGVRTPARDPAPGRSA